MSSGLVPEFAKGYGVSVDTATELLLDHLLLFGPIPLDHADPLGLASGRVFPPPSTDAWYHHLGITPEALDHASPTPVETEERPSKYVLFLSGRTGEPDFKWWIRKAQLEAYNRTFVHRGSDPYGHLSHQLPKDLERALAWLSPYYRSAAWCPNLLTRPVHRADVLIAADIVHEHVAVQMNDLAAAARTGHSYNQRYAFTGRGATEVDEYLKATGLVPDAEDFASARVAATNRAVKAALHEVLAIHPDPDSAAVVWLNWAVPRFFTAMGDEVATQYPTRTTSGSYGGRISPVLGDALIEQLGASGYSRERWTRALADTGDSGLRPGADQGPVYFEKSPVSKERIRDWIKDLTGFRYGDSPWSFADDGALTYRSPYHGEDPDHVFRWPIRNRKDLADFKVPAVARRFWEMWIEYNQAQHRRRYNEPTVLGTHMLGRAAGCGIYSRNSGLPFTRSDPWAVK